VERQRTPAFANRFSIGNAVRAKQIVTLVLVCVVAAPLLQGQSPANQETKIVTQPYIPNENNAIRVQSSIVDLNVVVRDAKGQLITGLTKEDFEIYDQGKKQIISSFDAELAQPPAVKMPEQIET
jgi:hypothetical protein